MVLQDISCIEDRPLIVQFCANTVETFISAASLVESYCEGVDLNLGCPQHIAFRGHFGAYLQDDWDLLHEMISESRKQLKIGICAKIRVFPEISKTVEYAKMLEKAGCQLLTVHGRTRSQKKLETGLASWKHIKAVKENLDIPVFANGNIQYFSDVERCMKETGVDGVMIAEGHLNNPMLFEGLQPNVFDVVEEYLSFVEKYPTPLSIVRAHLFNLLSPTLERHTSMREMLGNTSMMKIILTVCSRLRKLSEKDKLEDSIVASTGLPYWICQPYNKFERKRKDQEEKKDNNPHLIDGLSKNQMKKKIREERRIKHSVKKRKEEHQRRKERLYDTERKLLETDDVARNRVIRTMARKQAINDRLDAAMVDDGKSVVVCLDLSWCDMMNDKEINKLSSQLGRLYGSNRKCEKPAHLYFTGFERCGRLWEECVRKHNGFADYKIDMTSLSYSELFDKQDVVYLTPDSPTALENVEPGTVYVLGGLVDETVTKKLTLNLANKAGVRTRRLPVAEYMSRSGEHSNYSTVFCVNQVFDILLNYHLTRDWRQALIAGVPPRKGYILNENKEETKRLI